MTLEDILKQAEKEGIGSLTSENGTIILKVGD